MMKVLPKKIAEKKMDKVGMKNMNEYIVSTLRNVMMPRLDYPLDLSDITMLSSVP